MIAREKNPHWLRTITWIFVLGMALSVMLGMSGNAFAGESTDQAVSPRLSYRTASVIDSYYEKHEWLYAYTPTEDVRITTYGQSYKTIQYWDGYYISSVTKTRDSASDLWVVYYCVNNWVVY